MSTRNRAAWTEADYAQAGYVTVKLRLSPDAARALERLARQQGTSRTRAAELAILAAAGRKKPAV
jgi:hypothetical protein